jgi:hypothetical protein
VGGLAGYGAYVGGRVGGRVGGYGAFVGGRRRGEAYMRKRPLQWSCNAGSGDGLERPGGAGAGSSKLLPPCLACPLLPACREEVASLQEYIQGTF